MTKTFGCRYGIPAIMNINIILLLCIAAILDIYLYFVYCLLFYQFA